MVLSCVGGEHYIYVVPGSICVEDKTSASHRMGFEPMMMAKYMLLRLSLSTSDGYAEGVPHTRTSEQTMWKASSLSLQRERIKWMFSNVNST